MFIYNQLIILRLRTIFDTIKFDKRKKPSDLLNFLLTYSQFRQKLSSHPLSLCTSWEVWRRFCTSWEVWRRTHKHSVAICTPTNSIFIASTTAFIIPKIAFIYKLFLGETQRTHGEQHNQKHRSPTRAINFEHFRSVAKLHPTA
jgi:hypothetical protein